MAALPTTLKCPTTRNDVTPGAISQGSYRGKCLRLKYLNPNEITSKGFW